jgi:secreted PhoX family phosphatase
MAFQQQIPVIAKPIIQPSTLKLLPNQKPDPISGKIPIVKMTNHHNPEDFKITDYSDLEPDAEPKGTLPEFSRIADQLISRRGFLSHVSFGVSAFLTGTISAVPDSAKARERLEFNPVATNELDTITVPEGYQWHITSSWGDSLWSHSPDFDPYSRGTANSQRQAMGDNNDGMSIFSHQGRTVLVVNNEYVNLRIAHGNRESKKPENRDDVLKNMAGHGVTVCELGQHADKWRIVSDSEYNRRITADTPMEITGPARGHDLMKTDADPEGVQSLGTWNNCGNGQTPWGTYLACEENFNGYFSSSDETLNLSTAQQRYGIGHKDWGSNWSSVDERFDISKHPNEANRVGYIVEIDPLNPDSTPTKRTALGRFKHENAELVLSGDSRVVVYSGDDERGEFLYRFISTKKYIEGADNSNLLENGSLYVAKFDNDGNGAWLELTPKSTGIGSQAEICINTRQAASRVGATTMDRPEWIAAHPHKAELYCSLTKNRDRGLNTNKGGDDMPVNGPNPRAENHYGQILRWRPDNGDHSASNFHWDLFVLAGNPSVHSDEYAGSANINDNNAFNCPDGLSFDQNGNLWIRTDGNYSNQGDFSGMGNNQMLLADPVSGEIKRFLVGPRECEITGLAWSPDRKTAFVGIQHPGERGSSHFPDGGDSIPRSSIVAITRDDGKPIG